VDIKELDGAIKASADTNRIRILCMLQVKKMCVCEIAFVLGITQPSVSRHLKKLSKSGFVAKENVSFWTNYYLCPKNGYAKTFLRELKMWAVRDEVVARDRKKIARADREKLCCS
jgi:ArsR family transcriptional regulator, arsenate/arsenite/antimonite-responsive transcriptional repressor